MTYCKLCIGIIGNTIVHKFLFCNHGLPKWPPEQPITRHFRVFRHLQNHVSQRTYNRPVIIHVMVLPHNYTIKADNMLNVWVGCTVPLPSSQFWCKKDNTRNEMKWNMHGKKLKEIDTYFKCTTFVIYEISSIIVIYEISSRIVNNKN